MRKLVLVVSAFLAACGGGGGGGSSGSSGLSGTVGGKSFTPVEVKAIPAETTSGPCTLTLGTQTLSVGLKAIALQITSYANACGDFATTTCQLHKDAQSVTILVAMVNLLGTVPTLPPGTYSLRSSPIDPRAVSGSPGLQDVGFAQALGTSATSCAGTPSVASCSSNGLCSGTIRLDSVGDPVTGHVSVSFEDGSKLEGDFSAPVCTGIHPDICQIASLGASSGSICTGMNCL